MCGYECVSRDAFVMEKQKKGCVWKGPDMLMFTITFEVSLSPHITDSLLSALRN